MYLSIFGGSAMPLTFQGKGVQLRDPYAQSVKTQTNADLLRTFSSLAVGTRVELTPYSRVRLSKVAL